MKRDVQVGVTLGVIIMAIIGVFLSTRTSVKEPAIPIPEMEEETQGDALEVTGLSPEPQNVSPEPFKEVRANAQLPEQNESSVSDTAKTDELQPQKDDRIVDVEWKKAKEAEPLPGVIQDEKIPLDSHSDDWKDIPSGNSKKSDVQLAKYKVKSNDSLRKIANKYYGDESKWLLIFNANQDKIHDRNSLRIGTELIIPVEKTASEKTKEGRKAETTTPALSQVVSVEEEKAVDSEKRHTVLQGDTLYTLAVKYYHNGTQWEKIFDANKKTLKNKKFLRIGQELVIPDI